MRLGEWGGLQGTLDWNQEWTTKATHRGHAKTRETYLRTTPVGPQPERGREGKSGARNVLRVLVALTNEYLEGLN